MCANRHNTSKAILYIMCANRHNKSKDIRTCANKQHKSKGEIWVTGRNGADLVDCKGECRQQHKQRHKDVQTLLHISVLKLPCLSKMRISKQI